jgi:hypothetical protein
MGADHMVDDEEEEPLGQSTDRFDGIDSFYVDEKTEGAQPADDAWRGRTVVNRRIVGAVQVLGVIGDAPVVAAGHQIEGEFVESVAGGSTADVEEKSRLNQGVMLEQFSFTVIRVKLELFSFAVTRFKLEQSRSALSSSGSSVLLQQVQAVQ